MNVGFYCIGAVLLVLIIMDKAISASRLCKVDGVPMQLTHCIMHYTLEEEFKSDISSVTKQEQKQITKSQVTYVDMDLGSNSGFLQLGLSWCSLCRCILVQDWHNCGF